ncbi:MAG: hypothetical protein KGL48_11560 [Sphingomonadales bacterium]|nr:hypothetical protein [Sphingomonadales bacterium]MDE2568345.1 hypothetical protein [Sphingomonadales bacterium]
MRRWAPEEGTTTMSLLLLAAQAAAHAQEHEPTLLGLNAEDYVYVGITIFLLLAIFVMKAPGKITDVLDAQIAETRKNLDEAAGIRAEAEALLADARRKHEESGKEAAGLLQHARHEAETLVAKAEADTTALIARREKMAQDKIGAAERAAIEQLRGKTAEAAATAARGLIAENYTAAADKAQVNTVIAEIARH